MTEKKGFSVGKWAGHDNYQCDSCAFSTLNKDEIEEHVAFHKIGEVQGNAPAAPAGPALPDAGGDR